MNLDGKSAVMLADDGTLKQDVTEAVAAGNPVFLVKPDQPDPRIDSATELIKGYDFDAALVVGQIVHIRWTSCGSFYRAKAEVERISKKSVRAVIRDDPNNVCPGYPSGRSIKVPRWLECTNNNGVFPVEWAKTTLIL